MSLLAFGSAPDLRALYEGRPMSRMGGGRRPCRCFDRRDPRDSREAERGDPREDPREPDCPPEQNRD